VIRPAVKLFVNASYEKCMGGQIEKGGIYYYINWQVDEHHHGFSPTFEFADVPTEGEVSEEDKLAFAACVNDYLATHDQVELPHAGRAGMSWGKHAVFPLSDSQLLKMIAEATNKSEASDGGSTSPPPDAAAGRQWGSEAFKSLDYAATSGHAAVSVQQFIAARSPLAHTSDLHAELPLGTLLLFDLTAWSP
jgi:hypothetical protein